MLILHPDYQYTPKPLAPMASIVLASCILVFGVLKAALQFRFQMMGYKAYPIFDKNGRKLEKP